MMPMKQPSIRISKDDLDDQDEDALDLFYSGIKAAETKRTMNQDLKRFLVEACHDILEGDYQQRAQQFVNIARKDQMRTLRIVLAYIRYLRSRTTRDKVDPSYLNPSTIPNRVKPIKKILDMNGIGLAWKRIQSTYPEMDNIHKGRGYTKEEIRTLLDFSKSLSTDFIILALSSGGIRVGALTNLTWKDVFPIYEENGDYALELKDGKEGRIVCAGMVIYRSTPQEYATLISLEAWNKLQRYRIIWSKKIGREPSLNDPLILSETGKLEPITDDGARTRIEKLLVKAGIRTPLTEGNRRHTIPATHGFRRFWDKVMIQTHRKRGTLSALVNKERLMGHYGLVKTDKNYYWTDILELVPDYLEAMPELTITEEERLKLKS